MGRGGVKGGVQGSTPPPHPHTPHPGQVVKVPGRKTRFVYVRVNRAHVRVTYEGYPV